MLFVKVSGSDSSNSFGANFLTTPSFRASAKSNSPFVSTFNRNKFSWAPYPAIPTYFARTTALQRERENFFFMACRLVPEKGTGNVLRANKL